MPGLHLHLCVTAVTQGDASTGDVLRIKAFCRGASCGAYIILMTRLSLVEPLSTAGPPPDPAVKLTHWLQESLTSTRVLRCVLRKQTIKQKFADFSIIPNCTEQLKRVMGVGNGLADNTVSKSSSDDKRYKEQKKI